MTQSSVDATRVNNFDLLRFFAASQVVFSHAVRYLDVPSSGLSGALTELLGYFPGVPIFFVISGFLIAQSLERSSSLVRYGLNRLLRIFPALWVCLVVTMVAVTALGYWQRVAPSPGVLLPWIASEIAFGHLYSPSLFADFGVGKLNPSLWTIPVELQFYLALPAIYALSARVGARTRIVSVAAVIGLSAAAGHALASHGLPAHAGLTAETFLIKVFEKTLIPYLYMFLVGVLIHRVFDRLRPLLAGKAGLWLAGYAVACFVCRHFTDLRVGSNAPNFALFVVLAMTVISCAYTARSLANRLLRGNDISYGIYIYHMVVLNALIELGVARGWGAIGVLFGVSYGLAALSWRFIERPVLALKSRVPVTRVHPRSECEGPTPEDAERQPRWAPAASKALE